MHTTLRITNIVFSSEVLLLLMWRTITTPKVPVTPALEEYKRIVLNVSLDRPAVINGATLLPTNEAIGALVSVALNYQAQLTRIAIRTFSGSETGDHYKFIQLIHTINKHSVDKKQLKTQAMNLYIK